MRIAVFSDVHGNLTALNAVLEDMARRDVTEVVFAGDLCVFGPRPQACVQRLRGTEIATIYGNTDEWACGRLAPPARAADVASWTRAQLDEGELAWLAGLPFEHRISPTGKLEDDLLIVHANPLDVNQIIFPSEDEQMSRYGRVRQKDEELDPLLKGTRCAGLVFGHLHIPSVRSWQGLPLFNISSVSIPGDGDPRAKYGIFTWDGAAWSFARHNVAYDIQAEVAAYRQHQPPRWMEIVETIETEGYFPQNV